MYKTSHRSEVTTMRLRSISQAISKLCNFHHFITGEATYLEDMFWGNVCRAFNNIMEVFEKLTALQKCEYF